MSARAIRRHDRNRINENSNMKTVLAQLNSSESIDQNIHQIKTIINQFLAQQLTTSPILFVLPENSLFMRASEKAEVKALAMDSTEIQTVQKFCDEKKIYIHLTTAMKDQNKIWNASVLFKPETSPQIVYKKIHLFDIQLVGEKPVRESDVFSHGETVTYFDLEGVRFGSSICYDIRFAELFGQHAKNKVDVILVPAAFLVKTGQAHWEILLRARAIESQAYVLAPGQVGEHHNAERTHVRKTYGHSMAVDPWGSVVELNKDQVGCFQVEIDLEKIKLVRQQIPMSNHRRLDLK